MAFTAVLLVFVLFPRMFGGGGSRDGQPFDPRISRKGADSSGVCLLSDSVFTSIYDSGPQTQPGLF